MEDEVDGGKLGSAGSWEAWILDGMVGREINGNDGKTLLLAIRLSVASLMALFIGV